MSYSSFTPKLHRRRCLINLSNKDFLKNLFKKIQTQKGFQGIKISSLKHLVLKICNFYQIKNLLTNKLFGNFDFKRWNLDEIKENILKLEKFDQNDFNNFIYSEVLSSILLLLL